MVRRRVLIGCLAALAVVGIASTLFVGLGRPDRAPFAPAEPMAFTRDLLVALSGADRVTVTEHSYEGDSTATRRHAAPGTSCTPQWT